MLRKSRELPPTRSGHRSQNLSFHRDFVWVVNKCGEDRNQYDILELGDPMILPSDNEDEFRERVVFEGIEPTANCQFAVLLEPCKDGDLVPALIAGVVQSRITKTSTDPATPFSLKVEEGEYRLKQSSGGSAAQAIWAEEGDGEDKWAVIQLGQAAGKPPLVAYLNEALEAQQSASATLFEGEPGDLSLGSETVPVWDGIMDPGDSIEAGTKVWVAPSYDGELFVIVPYCKATGSVSPPPESPPPEEENPPWPEYPIPAHDIELMELIVPPLSTGDGGLNNEGEET
jgi:hypothetical protein